MVLCSSTLVGKEPSPCLTSCWVQYDGTLGGEAGQLPVSAPLSHGGSVCCIIPCTGHHVEMAKQHGALLVALEHRFYGYSVNPDGLELENLASLSSQQA